MTVGWLVVIYILGVVLFLYLTSIRPGKKKNQQMREMHDSVAPGDRIASIGGIVGTVVERDDEFVTMLIDEKTGTTMKIVVMAVQTILDKAE